MRKHSVWIVLAVLGLAGLVVLVLLTTCGTQEVDLSFETIERADSPGTGEYYEDKAPKLVIITGVVELDMLGNTVSSAAQAQLQDLDFDRYFAVGVFQGWRPSLPTPQSGVEVQRISRKGRTITIYAQFYEPVKGYEQRDVVTSPYQLIKMWKEENMQDELEFILNVDGTVVSQQTPILP